MSINAIIPAAIAAKVQGVDITLSPAEWHADTIAAIFTYGARRWMQDHVNAKANEFAKAKAEAESKGETFTGAFDVQAVIAARIAQAVSGELSIRTGGGETFTEMDDAVYDVAVKMKGAAGWKDLATVWATSKGLATPERKRAMLDCVAALPPAKRDAILGAARVAVESAAALRALTA